MVAQRRAVQAAARAVVRPELKDPQKFVWPWQKDKDRERERERDRDRDRAGGDRDKAKERSERDGAREQSRGTRLDGETSRLARQPPAEVSRDGWQRTWHRAALPPTWSRRRRWW
jgi:hypothetical protein